MTAIFVSDSYLLTPAVGLLGMSALWLPSTPTPARARLISRSARSGRVRLSRSIDAARADLGVRGRAVGTRRPRRGDAERLAKHAFYLAQAGQTQEAIKVATRLGAWAPGHPEYPLVLSKAVFLDKALTPEEKVQLLQSRQLEGPLGPLLPRPGVRVSGQVRSSALGAAPWPRNSGRLQVRAAGDAAEAEAFCQREGRKGCSALTEPLRSLPQWSEPTFRARLAAFQR